MVVHKFTTTRSLAQVVLSVEAMRSFLCLRDWDTTRCSRNALLTDYVRDQIDVYWLSAMIYLSLCVVRNEMRLPPLFRVSIVSRMWFCGSIPIPTVIDLVMCKTEVPRWTCPRSWVAERGKVIKRTVENESCLLQGWGSGKKDRSVWARVRKTRSA